MPMGWVAAATALSGAVSAYSANRAAGQQSGAANAATAAQLQMFNTINQQGAPYRQAGYTALADLMGRLGDQPTAAPVPAAAAANTATDQGGQPVNVVPWEQASSMEGSSTPFVTKDPRTGQLVQFNGNPDAPAYTPFAGTQAPAAPTPTAAPTDPNAPGLLHAFNAQDLGTNLSPSFNFMLGTGLGTVANKLNASGGNISGNTLRGMTQFAEDYASTGYQQAFENYTANQTNIFNRLADIAGFGQTTNQTTAGAGTSLGASAAQSQMAAGAAQAGGTVGVANALSGGATGAASWYAMPQMVKAFQGTPTGTVSDPGASGPG